MNHSLATHQAAASYLPMSALTAAADSLEFANGKLQEDIAGLPLSCPAPGFLCELLELMGCAEAQPDIGRASLSQVPVRVPIRVPVRQVLAGSALFLEGSRATHLYVVRVGTFKTIKTAEDGYEQVLAFAGRGEVIGFEGLCENRQPVAAVALESSSVYAVPLTDLSTLRQQSSALDSALQMALSRQLMRVSEMTELMAAVSSDVRLARFIAWWAARMAAHGQSSRRLLLRMSRRDIASLLGIAHETVSRSFTAFVDSGLLRVENREIEVLDPEGLKARAHNTRGFSDSHTARKSSTPSTVSYFRFSA